MKKLLLISVALLAFMSASAQENPGGKKLQNYIQFGAGAFTEAGYGFWEVNPGAVLRMSYGLDIMLDDKWSVMPGLGSIIQMGPVTAFYSDGGDPDGMCMADVFCVARYHFQSGDGINTIVGIGPQVSFMTLKDKYFVDADPWEPISGKPKFKDWDIGLQPSVVFLTRKHFHWGFEANFGLRNMRIQYPEYNRTGHTHFIDLMVTCGWHF